MAGERPKGGKGGRPKNGTPNKTLSAPTGFRKRSTSSAAVLASRLQQEHPTYYQGYLDGEHNSITAAAEAAGLVPHGHDPLKRLKNISRCSGTIAYNYRFARIAPKRME
jgi:hypothetical protein